MTAPARPARRWPALALGAAVLAALGGVAALAGEDPHGGGRATLDEMDMGLLQRNLLKLYVCEMESGINAKALAHYKVSLQAGNDPTRPTIATLTQVQVEEARTREKEISHYLLMEKTNAVQMIHIVDRILGTDAHVAGEGPAERVILEKRVELIEVPRGTEVREAGRIISEALGCPVRVETVETEINRVFFTMGPTTGEAIIKQFCGSAPYTWKIEGGTLVFRHRDLPSSGAPVPKEKPDDEK